jgi:hypothetical protein
MKQNLPLPVILAVLAVVLVGLVAFLVRKTANRENEGIDMARSEEIQKRMHDQMHRSTSPEASQKAYHGGQ